MRIASAILIAGLFASPAHAQALQTQHGDFDGDGAPDTVSLEPGSRPNSWQILVRLTARPGETFKLIEGFGVDPETIEVAPPGVYAVQEFGSTTSRTFAYDVILSLRRPNVRSVKYWNGRDFVGTWIVD